MGRKDKLYPARRRNLRGSNKGINIERKMGVGGLDGWQKKNAIGRG